MATVSTTEARKDLYRLVDQVQDTHEPIQITGKRGNAVLVGEADWRAMQETLFLVSIPGMRESILEGMATPPDELEDEPGWRAGASSTRAQRRRMPGDLPRQG
jgi:prevent-host-death family protein